MTDRIKFTNVELGGAYPQIDLLNGRNPEIEIQTLTSSCPNLEPRLLTRASCGSNIVPRHKNDLDKWAEGMIAANRSNKPFKFKVFDAQNNPEFIPLLELLAQKKLQVKILLLN